jgi:diguanylate cyclase (GGDEF)-like protein
MLIHSRFCQPNGEYFNFLMMSFSLEHLSMAMYFTAIGILAGIMQGLYIHKLRMLYEKAKSLSIRDELTSLYNRRHFLTELTREIVLAKRSGNAMSVIMIDLDHFKEYNDTYGHQVGDNLLKTLASRMKNFMRETDIVARYGGEEFVVILPNTTKQKAFVIAERLRAAMQNDDAPGLSGKSKGRITLSAGIAQFAVDAFKQEELISAADSALYKAKKLGRNRICLADAETTVGTA